MECENCKIEMENYKTISFVGFIVYRYKCPVCGTKVDELEED